MLASVPGFTPLASSSTMSSVPLPSASTAPVGLPSVMSTCWSDSVVVSPTTTTAIAIEVMPALNFKSPVFMRASAASAVPSELACTTYGT